MPAVYDHFHQVTRDEIDVLGHVNNLAYLKWMQDAAVAHSSAQGWPTQRYLDEGAGWVVRSHQIEYRIPARRDQEIVVRTWVASFKKITSLRKYRILAADDLSVLAVAQTNWAFIGFEHGVPRRVPLEIQEAFDVVGEEPPEAQLSRPADSKGGMEGEGP